MEQTPWSAVWLDGPPPDFLNWREKWAFSVFKPQDSCFLFLFFYNLQFNLIWIHWWVFNWKKPLLRCICFSKHYTSFKFIFQTQLSNVVTIWTWENALCYKYKSPIWGWTVEITGNRAHLRHICSRDFCLPTWHPLLCLLTEPQFCADFRIQLSSAQVQTWNWNLL